jgi:hypothetical protein
MKPLMYVRIGRGIITCKTQARENYPSINAAKRASRSIQMKTDGGLGRGTVKVS